LRFRTDSDCFALLVIGDTARKPSFGSAPKAVFELPLSDINFASDGVNAAAELGWTVALKPGSLSDY
jgi:hypothetical protein